MSHCIHQKMGCRWEGDISDLNIHLETCLYDLIDCPNKCGKKVANVSVEEHLNVFCTSMPRSCRHCGITTTGQDQVEHRNVCLKYPILCPNDCEVMYVVRELMETHLQTECARALVVCSFKHAGCRYEGTAAGVRKHMEIFQQDHLLLLSGFQTEKLKGMLEKLEEQSISMKKMNKILEDQAIEIEKLVSKVEIKNKKIIKTNKRNKKLVENKIAVQKKQILKIQENGKRKVQELEVIKKVGSKLVEDVTKVKAKQEMQHMELLHTVTGSSFTWRITDFTNKMKEAKNGTKEVLHSPEFYNHLNGYKMEGFVNLNGDNQKVQEEYISLYIVLLEGKYDDTLMWPFPYNIKFSINSQGNKEESYKMILDTAGDEDVKKYFQHPQSGSSTLGYGFSKFLLHEDVHKFVKDDILVIQFTFISK